MLSDTQWAVLGPLVEACRLEVKTPPQGPAAHALGDSVAASERRQMALDSQELGPWWRAAQISIRWSCGGVWERLLTLVQEHGVHLGMVFLDGTNMRAHQKAAGAAKRGDLQLKPRRS